jgi:predicted deacetylase
MTSAAATQFIPVVATGTIAQDALVVSLHDIAPSKRATNEKIIAQLHRLGVRTCSLLVVPDYHHREPIGQDSSFLAWLRELELDGHEIVIHGFFHERPRQEREGWQTRFITAVYTRGEGEFFDLDYVEASRRITLARDLFRSAGLTPRGFIAPAWLLSPEAERAARDAEMEYTTRLSSIIDLRSGDVFPARSVVYSTHSNWRRVASLCWNAGVFATERTRPLMRISIHPSDHTFPAVWAQLERFITSAMKGRTATTYREWIAERRISR